MQNCNQRLRALAGIVLALGLPATAPAQTASPERIEEVAKRGAEVMPFDLKQTQHIFTKTETGGVQQVVVRDPADAGQIELIRQHLTKISQDFARGDFSDPARIHGEDMPGLAELRSAPSGKFGVEYRELPNGAEIAYSSEDPALIAAVHRWFDAQITEHGHDAVPGHPHGAMHRMHKN
ncbi:cytochrome c family protein [Methylocaldum marinum]|uniref:Cytochrome c family protein n=1 Tax=Methylocaldum marinum TaxID=1432792 RepID=A0A250KZ67_9GAMM|nr:aspartate carbamoyltransferase [Methylocaldum marinum]BBA35079.1 cytochrome c family protein [Methylocaldum marinum]